jgi:dipeptidyl aminopeptidase/acylaminoacyl peptidase
MFSNHVPKVATITTLSILILSACTTNNSAAKNEVTPQPTAKQKAENMIAVSPAPTQFRELTIPYLRERKYESTLGELKKYNVGSNYTSYLTSYTSDGLQINGLLTQPKGTPPPNGWPAIVFVHGYIPPTQYKTTEKYVDYVDYLARNGFVVFKIDLRGHGSSQGEAGGGYYSSDYVIDTLNAYAALQASDVIDPQKIGLWGHSMAGNVTLRSVAAKQDIPALVIWAGAGYTYQDLRTYRISDNSYRPQPSDSTSQRKRREIFNLYGDFDQNSEFWKQVAPTNYLAGIHTPIELHHATDDNVVNIEYSRNLNKVLEGTALPHELYEYPSGGHNISGTSFTQAMQRTVNFYKQNLQ